MFSMVFLNHEGTKGTKKARYIALNFIERFFLALNLALDLNPVKSLWPF